MLFVQSQVYRRRDLHSEYGGQAQGGISTPAQHNIILLFTAESGGQHGYNDAWTEGGIFHYTGEGQRGDMQFVHGNLSIRDHAENGKDLHLFEQVRKSHVRYVGQMVCTGYHFTESQDTDGNLRRAIIFELAPLDDFADVDHLDNLERKLETLSIEELRRKAMASSAPARDAKERKIQVRVRSHAIKLYVLKRAAGVCEGCEEDAPFMSSEGQPYLEPHHLRRLSDGGPDHPRWVIAVCPNCHRRAHYAKDAPNFNRGLAEIVGRLERRPAD